MIKFLILLSKILKIKLIHVKLQKILKDFLMYYDLTCQIAEEKAKIILHGSKNDFQMVIDKRASGN